MQLLTLLLFHSVFTAHSYVLQPRLSVTTVEDWEYEADRWPNRTERPLREEGKGGSREEDAYGPTEQVVGGREEGEEERRNDGWLEGEKNEREEVEQNGEQREIVGGLIDHAYTEESEKTAAVSLISESIPHPPEGIHLTVPTNVSQLVSQETVLVSTPAATSLSQDAVDQNPLQTSLSVILPPQPSVELQETTLLASRLGPHDDLTTLQEVMEHSQAVHMREAESIPPAVEIRPTSKAVLSTTHNQESGARYNTNTAQPETSSGKSKQKLSQKANSSEFIQKPKNNQTTRAKLKVQQTVIKPLQSSKQHLSLLNKAISNQQRTKATLNERQHKLTPKTSQSKHQKHAKKMKDKKITRSLKDKKDKQKKKDKKEEIPTTPYFPFFKDDYCPSDCACYGRVVQCSDKGVDKVPFGIPYNSRYVLLMNNRIDSIQLDLLSEYLSMEFLVLSNNRLTDSSVEGSFEGVQNLKRLYLDRNLLQSIPADLPASLEELRLDGNNISGMSEAAWGRCPGLLILSLNNNSLGSGSDSLSAGVLSPLGSIRTLSLNHNQLLAVPSQLPLSLREVYLRGNLIQSFHGDVFMGDSELLVLDLSANRLGNKGLGKDALVNAHRLESLNLEGNLLRQVPRHLPPSLKTLNLEGNAIASVGKAAFKRLPNLEHLGLARNRIARVALGTFRTLPVLHQLDLSHNFLRHVPRQLPTSLHFVSATHNKIQSVPRDALCPGGVDAPLSQLVRVQLEHNLIDMSRLDTRAFRCLRGFQVVHFD
ncbi:extracellular matrix protein 2 [Alosa alosa]|uniref:extracellular matrix protein 2 n=1 Tax=Alosa alosa TaxID=278164 RepID=UPI0020155528|nr:extracellular matrix protein 2 [Alosa alosa]